jgi:alpha-galactosidase
LKNKGLKLGLGSDIGAYTCANQPGSYGFEQQDSLTYANWQYLIDLFLE